MLSCFVKSQMIINKDLSDYCKKTTNESIQKITEKYKLERIKPKISKFGDNDDEKPKFNFLNLLIFLSISTITIYFYKRVK